MRLVVINITWITYESSDRHLYFSQLRWKGDVTISAMSDCLHYLVNTGETRFFVEKKTKRQGTIPISTQMAMSKYVLFRVHCITSSLIFIYLFYFIFLSILKINLRFKFDIQQMESSLRLCIFPVSLHV